MIIPFIFRVVDEYCLCGTTTSSMISTPCLSMKKKRKVIIREKLYESFDHIQYRKDIGSLYSSVIKCNKYYSCVIDNNINNNNARYHNIIICINNTWSYVYISVNINWLFDTIMLYSMLHSYVVLHYKILVVHHISLLLLSKFKSILVYLSFFILIW